MTNVRVLHLSTYDFAGGAGRAAYRLSGMLSATGGEHELWVRNCSTDLRRVHHVRSRQPRPRPAYELEAARVAKNNGYSWSGAASGLAGIVDAVSEWKPDVIQLYWVCGDYLSLDAIGALLELGVPVVWRFSDLWPVTGGCHYPGECDGMRNGCHGCPALVGGEQALAAQVFSRKLSWTAEHVTIVAPSRWVAASLQGRKILAGAKVANIPTGVDLKLFTPVKREAARKLFDLETDTLVFAIGTANLRDDGRKGFPLIRRALEVVAKQRGTAGIAVLLFGTWEAAELRGLGFDVRCVGKVYAEHMLSAVYAAADLFLLGSTQDNLPNTAIEALASGTPVVAFDAGGVGELVRDDATGYLVRELSSGAYAKALLRAVADRARLAALGAEGREMAEDRLDLHRIAEQYHALYRNVVMSGGQVEHPSGAVS